MKRSILFPAIALMAALANQVFASDVVSAPDPAKASDVEVEVEMETSKEGPPQSIPSTELGGFCFIALDPPSEVKYTVIRKLKVGKGTYGSVKDVLPKLAGYARDSGADAIIGYAGSQRFGFWPWRVVRPIVRGTAIKWSSPPNMSCAEMGGSTLDFLLASDATPVQ